MEFIYFHCATYHFLFRKKIQFEEYSEKIQFEEYSEKLQNFLLKLIKVLNENIQCLKLIVLKDIILVWLSVNSFESKLQTLVKPIIEWDFLKKIFLKLKFGALM